MATSFGSFKKTLNCFGFKNKILQITAFLRKQYLSVHFIKVFIQKEIKPWIL